MLRRRKTREALQEEELAAEHHRAELVKAAQAVERARADAQRTAALRDRLEDARARIQRADARPDVLLLSPWFRLA